MAKKFKGKSYPKIEVREEGSTFIVMVNGAAIDTFDTKEKAERRAVFYARCFAA